VTHTQLKAGSQARTVNSIAAQIEGLDVHVQAPKERYESGNAERDTNDWIQRECGEKTHRSFAHVHTSYTNRNPNATQLLPQHIQAPTLPKTLSPKSTCNLIGAPINLHLPAIYILIDPDYAVVHVVVLLLARPEHLEHEVAADGRVVGVAKVFVDALLEGFDAFAQFFGVVGVNELFEDGAGVGGALGY